MKVSFMRKLLFFFGLKDLTDDIDLEFNPKTRIGLFIPYFILLYALSGPCLDFFLNHFNLLFRIILVFGLLFVFVELLYWITIKMYNKES